MEFLSNAHDSFKIALSEVSLLLDDASNSEKDQLKYNVYCKSALLLLMAKFENFIENTIEEYCDALLQKRLEARRLPESLKWHVTREVFSNEFLNKLQQRKSSVPEGLIAISQLWSPTAIPSFSVNSSFSYGKHGEKEVRKLFNRIGVDDIFDAVSPKVVESLAESGNRTEVAGVLNSLVGWRNNIIHEDGSPALTHVQMIEYVDMLSRFSEDVASFLAAQLVDFDLPRYDFDCSLELRSDSFDVQ